MSDGVTSFKPVARIESPCIVCRARSGEGFQAVHWYRGSNYLRSICSDCASMLALASVVRTALLARRKA